jgi:hypothetical protein
MLQKIAAMMDNVAADLHFVASKVRLLLQKINFTIAAFSAATFMCLYIIVMPYLQHYSVFVPENRNAINRSIGRDKKIVPNGLQ